MTEPLTDMAVSLAATLAAERIAQVQNCSCTEALYGLLGSAAGAALYDDQLKYWWESPLDIADAYLRSNGWHK